MPILDEHTLDFISHSTTQTHRFGVRLGLLLEPGDIICLEGKLGAGKTCLAQGIGEGMGVVEPITSPTFTLIAEYSPPPPAPPLYHIDVFRLEFIRADYSSPVTRGVVFWLLILGIFIVFVPTVITTYLVISDLFRVMTEVSTPT